MSGFYKADLSEDPAEWTETVIAEGIGTPDEHRDRFWRKGPYGIEEEPDGTFEAYVIVGDTPFKIGGGLKGFADAVMFITSAMVSKDLPEGAEDPSPKLEGPGPEAAEESEGEPAPPAPEPEGGDAEDAEDATEAIERSDTGEIKLGPEANPVGKSEGFEKVQHPVQYDEATGTYPMSRDDLAELDGAAAVSYDREAGMLPPDADTSVLGANPEGEAAGRVAHEGDVFDGESRRLPSRDYLLAAVAERAAPRAVAKSASHAMMDSIFSTDPKERDVTDAQLRFRRSDDAGGEGCRHVEDYDPGHPGDVYERHYIDDHALGSARLMADAPSLEAFERSVGDFRGLMASKSDEPYNLYADPEGFARSESFEKRRGGGMKNPNNVPSAERRQRIEMGLDPRGDSSADSVIPDTGYLTARSPTLGANAQGTDIKTYVDRNTGELYNGRSRFTDRMGHYRDVYGGEKGNRHHGERNAGSLAERIQGRGMGVPTEDNPGVESFKDIDAQTGHADKLLRRDELYRRANAPAGFVEEHDPSQLRGRAARAPHEAAPAPDVGRYSKLRALPMLGQGATLADYMEASGPRQEDIIDVESGNGVPLDMDPGLAREMERRAKQADSRGYTGNYRDMYIRYGPGNFTRMMQSIPIPADTQDPALQLERAYRLRTARKKKLPPEAAQYFADNGLARFMSNDDGIGGYNPLHYDETRAGLDPGTSGEVKRLNDGRITVTEQGADRPDLMDDPKLREPQPRRRAPTPDQKLRSLDIGDQMAVTDLMRDAYGMYQTHLYANPGDVEGAKAAADKRLTDGLNEMHFETYGNVPEASVKARIMDSFTNEFMPKVTSRDPDREQSGARMIAAQYGADPRGRTNGEAAPTSPKELDARREELEERFSPEEQQDARNRAELRSMANALEESGREEAPQDGASRPKRVTDIPRRESTYDIPLDRKPTAREPVEQEDAKRKELKDAADRTYTKFMDLKAKFDPLHEMRLANEKQMKGGKPPIKGYNPKEYNRMLDEIQEAQREAQAAQKAYKELLEAHKPTPSRSVENNTGGELSMNMGAKRQDAKPPKSPEDAPKAEQRAPEEPKSQEPKRSKEPKQEPPKEPKQDGDSIAKSDDPSKVSFRDMYAFERSKRDGERGAPVSMDPIGYDGLRDGQPFKELYRRVTMGEGKDCSSSAYDPTVRRTDSEPRH